MFVFHTPEDHGLARAHLPGFTCWVAGSALDQALAGELDDLAAMVLAQTCDTLQGLADLWRRNVRAIPLVHFGMPQRLDSPAARAYLLAELRDLRGRLEALTGQTISDDVLRESLALANRTRALVRGLYARAAGSVPAALYSLVRAVFREPKELYNRDVESRVGELGGEPGVSNPRLLVVGPALGDPVLFDVISQAGGRVVGDLLDLGERAFAVDAAEEGDPLEAVAERLLALLPTPTKIHLQRPRADHLLSLVRERGAQGVVFARQKFCEPHGFDVAQMARALDRASVPHLLVELEQASQAGQLHTRVEAFVEMISQV